LEKGELEGFPPPVTLDAQLAAEALTVLLETVAPERGISLEALLLGALAQVWAELTDRPLVVMVERHGRDQVAAGLDVSRTVGWFTVVMTLTLDGHAGAYAAAAIAAQRLRDTAPTVPSATADLVFNHLGTLTAAAGGAFTVNWDAPGPAVSPALALAPGLELLTALQQVEQDLERVRGVKNGPRTIDLDLLLFGDLVLDTPQLQVPHPGLLARDFMMLPLLEIAPTLWHPLAQRPLSALTDAIQYHQIISRCAPTAAGSG
jgi:hypothetical protein